MHYYGVTAKRLVQHRTTDQVTPVTLNYTKMHYYCATAKQWVSTGKVTPSPRCITILPRLNDFFSIDKLTSVTIGYLKMHYYWATAKQLVCIEQVTPNLKMHY